MPEEEKRISPVVAIVGAALGLGALGTLALVALARAAPPEGYPCPYCPDTFTTFEDLVTHIQTEHPGERIPIEIEWE